MYLNGVMGVHFLVDFFLLLASCRLCGYPSRMGRILLASSIGAIYAGFCLLPDYPYSESKWMLLAVALLMVLLAFGIQISTIRRGAVFLLLKLAIIGVAGILDSTLLMALGALLLLCFLADHMENRKVIPVELPDGSQTLKITALRDTGNLLKDPITGERVLVVSGPVAEKLTGLTARQLENPYTSITAIPGLRLIPYHSVGRENGMLLAMKLPGVRIGRWRGSALVAFAPGNLSSDHSFEALTGGN